MERRQREEQEQKRRHLAESVATATSYYRGLATRNEHGEAYAKERGVLEAVNRGLVRFDRADHGSIALALRTSDGRIANVIRRRLPEFAPTKNDRFRPLARLWAQGSYINARDEIGPASKWCSLKASSPRSPQSWHGRRRASSERAVHPTCP